MEYTIKARYIKTSPKKIRMFIPTVLNTDVSDLPMILEQRNEGIARNFLKIINAALDHVKSKDGDIKSLKIKQIRVDEGPALKRRIFKARGRADLIKKRSSHIILKLEDKMKKRKRSKKAKI